MCRIGFPLVAGDEMRTSSAISVWPHLEQLFGRSSTARVLPSQPRSARECLALLALDVDTTLGAICETGGVLLERNWIRLLGSGHPELNRRLVDWNARLGIPLDKALVIADDVVGGVFAINLGGFGSPTGSVFYFSPVRLQWIDLARDYGAFLEWIVDGDLAEFYAPLRWTNWEVDVAAVRGDQSIALFPPPSTDAGRDVSKVSKKVVPLLGLWRLQLDMIDRRSTERR